MAARAGVPHLVLTHLIPPFDQPAQAIEFAEDVRNGGYDGKVTVSEDLATVTFGSDS